ncbi:MAG: PKD domain-containing protein [Candidatus Pacebacteria bacterium]|nr:PKD domain-containing protein [Candidatus Paceibacterota bacterium]
MNLSIIKKSASEKFSFSINVLISVAIIFSGAMFLLNSKSVNAGNMQNTTGFAWSENIGWISFNNLTGGGTSDYGVNLNLDTGIFSGFAWSENIGWISFNAADLAGCPSGVCDARVALPNKIGKETVAIEGWAKALSYGGGWDGWISLKDSGEAYGTTMDTSGNWSGWAWGGDVVGWVNFNGSGYQVNTSFVPVDINPKAIDLTVSSPSSDTYCNTARHTFSWTYSDPLEKAESRFQMQVDNNSDFLSPEVDRNQSGLSYPSPTINTQQVLVIDVPESDKLVYGETYNWRVKVYNDDNGHSDWIVGTPFTTDYVEYPTVVYTWLPFKPNEDDVVQFTDSSTVTEGASTTERVWEFQDGSPGTSVEQSPMTTFLSQGSKQVSLRITDSNGKSCTLLSTVEVKWPLPNWKEILPF